MSLLRYADQERANIAKALSRATQQARLNASLAQRAAEEEATDLFGDAAGVTSVPATAASTGTAGQIAYDGSYLYVCVADSTWLRTAISTW